MCVGRRRRVRSGCHERGLLPNVDAPAKRFDLYLFKFTVFAPRGWEQNEIAAILIFRAGVGDPV